MSRPYEPQHIEWQRLSATAALLITLAGCLTVRGGAPFEVNLAREQDPGLELEQISQTPPTFDPRLKALWLEALGRAEADLKREAADAIARAHQLGMAGLEEAVPRLIAELEAPGAHPVVRLAAARTLITLNARQAAPVLMRHAREDGFDAARLIEPVLAQWNYVPMRPVWLARMANQQTPRGSLKLAVRAAAATKLADAVPHLRRLALSRQEAGDLRLDAARSLAALQPAGLEAEAQLLLAGVSPHNVLDHLVAATLVSHHRGPVAENLMLQLARDRTPAVAAVAVRRLLEIDPRFLQPLLEGLLKNSDAGLRLLAAQALADLRTPEAVARLGVLLDDPNVDVRVFAREVLIRLAVDETQKEPFGRALKQALSARGPRGREQAIMVVGATRYEPAVQDLLQALDDRNVQVNVAAAWALRRLANLATADPILQRVQSTINRMLNVRARKPAAAGAAVPLSNQQMQHLIEALGLLHYQPAAPLLKQFLPVPPPPGPGPISPFQQQDLRTAAVWSLGHIYAGNPPAELAALFQERMSSDAKPRPEDIGTRAVFAINLGRMKVEHAAPALREYYRNADSPLNVRRASAWALEQITGKPTAPPAPRQQFWQGRWFLEPIDR